MRKFIPTIFSYPLSKSQQYTLHTLTVGFILLHLTLHFTHHKSLTPTASGNQIRCLLYLLKFGYSTNIRVSRLYILSLAIKYVFPCRLLGHSINMWLRLTYGECSRDCVRSQFESHFKIFFFFLKS